MITDGTFSSDGIFTKFATLDSAAITVHFADHVLAALRMKGLIDDAVVAQILSQEHSGFHAWFGDPFDDPDSERFVARYIERGPISLEKLSIEADIVAYTTNDGKAHEFDALEFLALLSAGVPKPYESLTRYYGWYACRVRGERKKLVAVQEQGTEEKVEAAGSWAACIKRIYEISPLECPLRQAQGRQVQIADANRRFRSGQH